MKRSKASDDASSNKSDRDRKRPAEDEQVPEAEKPRATTALPKRPMSAYNLFFRDVRKQLTDAHTKTGDSRRDFAAVTRKIGRQWKALPQEERSMYDEMAKKEMSEYQNAIRQYELEKQQEKDDDEDSSKKEPARFHDDSKEPPASRRANLMKEAAASLPSPQALLKPSATRQVSRARNLASATGSGGESSAFSALLRGSSSTTTAGLMMAASPGPSTSASSSLGMTNNRNDSLSQLLAVAAASSSQDYPGLRPAAEPPPADLAAALLSNRLPQNNNTNDIISQQNSSLIQDILFNQLLLRPNATPTGANQLQRDASTETARPTPGVQAQTGNNESSKQLLLSLLTPDGASHIANSPPPPVPTTTTAAADNESIHLLASLLVAGLSSTEMTSLLASLLQQTEPAVVQGLLVQLLLSTRPSTSDQMQQLQELIRYLQQGSNRHS